MSDKKIYVPYDFQASIKVQELATLPTWTTEDRRRIVRYSGDGEFYFGGSAGWVPISMGDHNHDTDYAAIDHNHATVYATLSHAHAGVYSTVDHNHASAYAALTHAHDYSTAYAALSHVHSGVYATLSHTHDYSATYAALSHTHTTYASTNHTHTTFTASITVAGAISCTDGLYVDGLQVIGATGMIDYSWIENHPTYCSTDCDCDCSDNA